MKDWTERASRLSEDLVTANKLRSPEWIAAVRAIPRHALIPVFYEQEPGTGEWLTREVGDPQWCERIYSNRGLFTKIGERAGPWGTAVVGLSSTSTPGLMTRMLEALDLEDGHDVLEIGTGTGYNAALLAYRLGDAHVFSVDIEADLISLARKRLAAIGLQPTLVTADGADGLPEHAPYDRIIATCAVAAIPDAWLPQTRIGGSIMTDLKLSVHAGNLVLLQRHRDRAEGRFDRTWAGFMPLRPVGPAQAGREAIRDRDKATRRTTDLDLLRPWENLVVWFLAHLLVSAEIGYGHTIDTQTGRPADVFLTGSDGSWCEVDERAENGARQVWEAGPTPLWRVLEDAHQLWRDVGQPGWDRFGLTVTSGHQWVWLDSPDSKHAWPLGSPSPGP